MPVRAPRQSRRHTVVVAGCALALGLSAASPSGADPAIVAPPHVAALSWVREPGAEDCPAGPVVGAEVERVLGAKLTSLSQADLVIEGRVARALDGFETVLTVTARGGAMLGTRKLTSQGPCGAITAEVGLVIALMIDPDAAMRPTTPPAPAPPPPAPPANPAPIVTSVVCAPPPPAPPPSPRASWGGHVSVGAVMGAGLLPSPGFGVRGRIAIAPPGLFPLEIGAELFAPVRVELAGRGVTAQLAQGFVRACPLAPQVGRFAFAGCVGFDAGSLQGAGFGFAVNRAAELPVVAGAFAARADVRLASILHASLGADLAIPFFRGRFYYDASDGTAREAYLTAPIAGTVDLSIGLALP